MTKLYKLELGNTSQFQLVGQEGIKYSCLYVKQIVPRMSNLTRICFTLNNYSAEEEAQIVNLKNDERIKYMIVGRRWGNQEPLTFKATSEEEVDKSSMPGRECYQGPT